MVQGAVRGPTLEPIRDQVSCLWGSYPEETHSTFRWSEWALAGPNLLQIVHKTENELMLSGQNNIVSLKSYNVRGPPNNS